MRLQMTWAIALTLVVSPALSYGAETEVKDSETKVSLRNVELTKAGTLEGQVLTTAGVAVADAKVVVRSQTDVRKVGQELVTDRNGRFIAAGLKTGTCIVETGDETYAVRVWQTGTAPPKSLKNVALVRHSQGTVRGNWLTDNRLAAGIRSLTPRQKLCLGVLVGAAIAIPIALDDDDDAS